MRVIITFSRIFVLSDYVSCQIDILIRHMDIREIERSQVANTALQILTAYVRLNAISAKQTRNNVRFVYIARAVHHFHLVSVKPNFTLFGYQLGQNLTC